MFPLKVMYSLFNLESLVEINKKNVLTKKAAITTMTMTFAP